MYLTENSIFLIWILINHSQSLYWTDHDLWLIIPDSGDIWKKSILQLKGDELLDSINKKLYKAETDLIEYAINSFDTIKPEKQNNLGNMNYYKRRTPSCSELNIDLTIREQFNLLRTVDNERFPAYFKYNNKTYILSINEKKNDE